MYETVPTNSEILFKFRLINISSHILPPLSLHLELGPDISALSYPTAVTKPLSIKESTHWQVLVTLEKDTTPPIAVLKVSMDDIEVCSKAFAVSPIDLLVPDTTTG